MKISAQTRVLSIPDEKVNKIEQLCKNWFVKNMATRNQIQKLLGHFLYLHKCMLSTRFFINNTYYLVLKGCAKIGQLS